MKKKDSSKMTKTLNLAELKEIIVGELKLLKEESKAKYQSIDTGTNIKGLDTADVYRQLTSGDEGAPLIKAIMSATKWASGAVAKAGGPQGIKDWAEGVGAAELSARISKVGNELPATGLAKKDMPALEGEDADEVQDALSPGGKFNVDIEADYAGGESSVDDWMNSLSSEDR